MQNPDYPIHWIFDYFPAFTADERDGALLLFDGKTVREMAYQLDGKTVRDFALASRFQPGCVSFQTATMTVA